MSYKPLSVIEFQSVVNIPGIVEYKYDVKKDLWCEISMQVSD